MNIRQGSMTPSPDYIVNGASLPPRRKAGEYLWRFTVPPNGERTMTHKLGICADHL